MPFEFIPQDFSYWNGRYGSIPGRLNKYRIKNTYEYGWWPVVEADITEGTILYLALDDGDIDDLVKAVNDAKCRMDGQPGGSFIINEFGQVIVPSNNNNDNRKMLVGELESVLLFEDPRNGNMLDVSDDSGLRAGDLWDRPYLGIPYNLSQASNIYFSGNNDQLVQYPTAQDYELIAELRAVRPSGPVRFLVNAHGLVLAKAPVGRWTPNENHWKPFYIGRINYDIWFQREG